MEKTLILLVVVSAVSPPILITFSLVLDCVLDNCDDPFLYLPNSLAQNVITFSGVWLGYTLIATPVLLLNLSVEGMFGFVPWIVLVLMIKNTKDIPKLRRIIYIWIIVTELSYAAFKIKPVPIGGV